jgi:hypothetical protein
MTVYSKNSYDYQDDGRILKASRKQQYIMFPAPIVFLNDKLKAELGMKTKKEDFSIKVPMDATYKESNTYLVKIRKYDMGSPDEFFKWPMMLNEQMKNHGYGVNYEMVMNLAQSMLEGRELNAFLNERRAKYRNKKRHKANQHTELAQQQIYDCAIFELAIPTFDIHSGRRDAFERQREYRIRDIFMWKLNPKKCSQSLREMNKNLDFIPIEK